MKTIKENVSNTIVINKSEFICELIKIKDFENIKLEYDKLKTKYKDATHYCYAYIFEDKKKSSDDGEPGGTAGIPILDTLNKQNLDYILCVVIRYFGGIKLGAGGLIRAYRKAVSEALNKASFTTLENGYLITVEVSYDKQKEIENLITNYTKDYQENVIYKIECTEETKKLIEKNYKIINEAKKVIEI